jgi:AcrR family transcriptional regulator
MKKRSNAENRIPEILESYYQVILDLGFEGASIGKVAKYMDIHPSLIIHYFKSKENMNIELVKLIIEKFNSPQFLKLDHIQDLTERFTKLIDVLFSFDWSRTVHPTVFYAFYYLSFRNPSIKERFQKMFMDFRDYLTDEFRFYKKAGIIFVDDPQKAADMIVTLVEGLEFHAGFLKNGQPFDIFADYSKQIALGLLKQRTEI